MLAQDLVRCPSVTPDDAGALDVLVAALEPLGFACHRLRFAAPGTEPVENLYARLGTEAPHFCFAGHTDVVPVGAATEWSTDPFAGVVRDGMLHGRGATDMKGAIAAFVGAVVRFLDQRGDRLAGSISLLITGDEEGPAVNGTRKVLDWLKTRGEHIDYCVVGEPTNPTTLGEMTKIGRRGSLNGTLTVHGNQGHVAYPHLADNPIPRLVAALAALDALPLDEGTEHFQPSNLEITSVDVGNAASNVVPGSAVARFNVRFNDLHTGASLADRFRKLCSRYAGRHDLDIAISGEAFLTPPGPLSSVVVDAVTAVTGTAPELSTSGGTSDARFIKDICPVVEFGLISRSMHKIDECVAVDDIVRLSAIYHEILCRALP